MACYTNSVSVKCVQNFAKFFAPVTTASCNIHINHSVQSQHESATKSNPNRPLFRTTQSNPSKHENQHHGLFYEISKEDVSKFYAQFQRPHILETFKAFNEACVMVREPAIEVIDCIKQANYDFPVIRYLLYGRYGAGKSLTLSHISHACAVSDWCLVRIPWGPVFTKKAINNTPSTTRPGRIDTPLVCSQWLTEFKKINSNFLAKHNPVLTGNYTWTKRDRSEEGSPMINLLNYAMERPKFSTDIMNVLLKEIKLQSNAKKFKTLVAVDGVNCIFEERTELLREEDTDLFYEPHELSVVHNIKKMLRNDWRNAAVVCTVDTRATLSQADNQSYLPLYLLKQKGFELLDPFYPIHVDKYSDKEIYSALEYFIDRKWIQNPLGHTEEAKKEIIFMSCHNPLELFYVTRAW